MNLDKELPRISIRVQRHAMPAATDEQFIEWVKYQTGLGSDISTENPLCDADLQDYTSIGTLEIR